MSKKVATVGKGGTFTDALKAMLKHRTNGIVVVDEKNHVVGILSSWDLIQYVVPDYLEEDRHLAAFESADVNDEIPIEAIAATLKDGELLIKYLQAS